MCGRIGEGGGTNKQSSFPYLDMHAFDIPTGPTITQGDLAYNTLREEACCAKQITMLQQGSLAYDRKKAEMTLLRSSELTSERLAQKLLRSTQRSIQEMETHLYEGVESV